MFENSLIVVNIKLDNARWFLRGLNKPFDPFAQKAMHDTMIGIANCTEAVWAYHIGNEIVLYLNPNAISRCKTMLSGMTRDNLVSYIASLTTVIFNLNYGRLMEKLDKCCYYKYKTISNEIVFGKGAACGEQLLFFAQFFLLFAAK